MENFNRLWQPSQSATTLPTAPSALPDQRAPRGPTASAQPGAHQGVLHFFLAGLMRHAQTGSFIPSQRHLIDVMIAPLPRDYTGTVVELGTGTGPLTVRLARRCPKAKVVGCEINPVLAHDARVNLAQAGFNGSAEVKTISAQELLRTIRERSGEFPGFVISGLPIGNMKRNAVRELLQSCKDILASGGLFVQAQHFLVDRKNVKAIFSQMRIVPVWRNFPPVFVYYATK